MKRASTFVLATLASAAFVAAASAEPAVYVPLGSGNEIRVLDADTDRVTGTIADLREVHGLAGTANGAYLIAGSFAAIDPAKMSAPPKPASVTEDEHRAHHATAGAGDAKPEAQSFLSVIRTTDGTVVRRITVPGAVHHVALTPDARYAIATLPGQDAVSIVDLADFTVVKTLKTGSTPNYAVVSRDGRRAYVSNAGDDTVSEISTEGWSKLRVFQTGAKPEHLALAANAEALYAANVGDGTVSVIPLAKEAETRTIAVGGRLHGIDLSDDNRMAFVSATERNELAAIDLRSGRISRVPLGPSPYHLATIPGAGKLYVSSADAPTLWVIDQATLSVRRTVDIRGKGHQMVVLNR